MTTTILRLDTFASLRLDVTTKIQVENQIAVTEHPIEDGSVVTDHAQDLPRRITVEGIVTDTPFQGSALDAAFPGRSRRAREFLEGLVGVQVSIQTTKHGTFSPCLLQSWPFTDDGPSRLQTAMVFSEVQFGEVGHVSIPAEITTSAGLSSAQEVGDQATEALPDDVALQAKQAKISLLLALGRV